MLVGWAGGVRGQAEVIDHMSVASEIIVRGAEE